MTIEDIQHEVLRVTYYKDDDEIAHHTEDELYENFISYIANNAPVPKDVADMASAVLETKRIEFKRWCA